MPSKDKHEERLERITKNLLAIPHTSLNDSKFNIRAKRKPTKGKGRVRLGKSRS